MNIFGRIENVLFLIFLFLLFFFFTSMGKPQARSRKHVSKDKRKDIKTKRRVKGLYYFYLFVMIYSCIIIV